MSTTDVHEQTRNAALHRNGTAKGLAVEYPDTSTARIEVDYEALLRIGRDLIIAIGENPDREGLLETPRRFASSWREFIEYDPGKTETMFENITTDQMVVISGLRVWSFCEHHLLPFWCDVTIGYIAEDKVLGLSKFARIAHQYAHKLQLQERLCTDIADEIERITGSKNVAVMARGEHTCMMMRGIRTNGQMTTSVTRGIFRAAEAARNEFLKLAGLG